jgi:hypothetical protein
MKVAPYFLQRLYTTATVAGDIFPCNGGSQLDQLQKTMSMCCRKVLAISSRPHMPRQHTNQRGSHDYGYSEFERKAHFLFTSSLCDNYATFTRWLRTNSCLGGNC